ncbi:MAG: type II toxin-antitoxin system VapC family toxin [Gemmatimonadota bacterium]
MSQVLVDSNVIIDVLTEDANWFEWSAKALEEAAESDVLFINPIIYSEVSVHFSRIEDLDAAVPPANFRREALPWQAGFLAGKAFHQYRKRGGERRSPLPDFYIGAHAAIRGATLLTRDASRYRSLFPRLEIISPA